MADYYKESRYRDRDDSPSDDERRHTTIRRYKVTSPSKYDDDDRRSHYSPRTSLIDKQLVERDRDVELFGDDHHSAVYEKEYERERRRTHRHKHDDDRSRGIIYDPEFDRGDRDWGNRRDHDDTDVRMEKRVERTSDGDLKIQKRYEEHIDRDGDGHPDVERYRKETEYYSPYDPPSPRHRAPEQTPFPPPAVIPRQDPNVMVIPNERPRELVHRPARHDDEYYYRHESKEIGPYRREEREVERRSNHHRRGRDYASDAGGVSDDGYIVRRRRRTIIRDRSSSSDSDHKLHLAEGALAGAGVTALISSRRDKNGDLPEHRGRKVVAGAALGALGTEAYKRARSAYGDRFERHRSHSRGAHSRIKTGLGIAAAALAVAGATQYYKSSKVDKEESNRGRSRTKNYHSDGYSSRSRSRKSIRSRSKSVVKAAMATMAGAGLVKHLRNRSKSKARSSRSRSASTKSGRSRSRSRLRTGAGIAAAAVAAGTAGKVYKRHKEKKEKERERGASRSSSASASFYEPRRRSRSRSHSRSATARSLHSEASPADRELGLIEYGQGELPPDAPPYPDDDGPRDRRRRRRRDRDRSSSLGEYSASDEDKKGKKRSMSRLRDMAAAAVGTGAAAMGIKEYKRQKSKDREGTEGSGDGRKERRRRERDRRRYEDDDRYDDGHFPPSPPHASGGYSGRAEPPNMSGAVNDYSTYPPQTYYPTPPADPQPPYPTGPPPPDAQGYPPPPPPDAHGYPPPPPPGASPAPPGSGYPPQEQGYPPPGSGYPPPGPGQSNRPPPMGPDHPRSTWGRFKRRVGLSDVASDESDREDLYPPRRKTVAFTPMSPQSSRALRQHRRHGSRSPPRRARTQKVHGRDSPLERRRHSSGPPAQRRVSEDLTDSDSESGVEDLPDRFDSHGRPLSSSGIDSHWTERNGQFRRRPRREGDWGIDGGWHVSGTDKETVERVAKGDSSVV
ncbi:uncharacterized protein DNG_01247 [Cephalotrichum gorgonifer]|uniref:DUF3824 domain-containing protein n=1 Tax=Cephalotrichum gorgonifer TaxID=2041049 RepID=A0AAE8MRI8_9PEZI|nr:uncharacterized protein DNG_01247 [Cephalotrichum gorgonifer]